MDDAPPPLYPMDGVVRLGPVKNGNTKRTGGLGAALASLSNNKKNKSRIYLEEAMEPGLGIGQHTEDDAFSVHQQDNRDRDRAGVQERRASDGGSGLSLIENSRKFHQKFLKFMDDYSGTNAHMQPVQPKNNPLEEDTSNRFPTRSTDLRHVDQRINLMDASSARYGLKPNGGGEEEEEDISEEDDVYNNYIYGFNTPSPSEYTTTSGRRGSLQTALQNGVQYLRRAEPPHSKNGPSLGGNNKQHGLELVGKEQKRSSLKTSGQKITLIPGCGGIDCAMKNSDIEAAVDEEWEDFSPVKKSWRDRYGCLYSVRWLLLIGFFLLSATFFLAMISFYDPGSHPMSSSQTTNAPVSSMEQTLLSSSSTETTSSPSALSTSGSSIKRRKVVLEHVLEKILPLDAHNPELDPSQPKAQIAMEWMAGYDTKSIILLDNYNFKQPGDDGLRHEEDYENPDNHVAEIMNRYVQSVYHFLSHPNETAKTATLG